jgi:hypothetical protein
LSVLRRRGGSTAAAAEMERAVLRATTARSRRTRRTDLLDETSEDDHTYRCAGLPIERRNIQTQQVRLWHKGDDKAYKQLRLL